MNHQKCRRERQHNHNDVDDELNEQSSSVLVSVLLELNPDSKPEE